MNIAYLTTQFPHYSQTFVLNEVEAHHQAGVEILPLSCDRAPEKAPVSEVARAWQRRTVCPGRPTSRLWSLCRETIRSPRRVLKNVVWLGGLSLIDPLEALKGLRELFTAVSLAPACRAQGTQLIHVHFASRCLTAGIMLGRLLGVPVTCTVHAFDLWLRSGRNLRYRLKHCRFIAAISQYNVDYLRRRCGAEIADLCHVVHCGIDTAEFNAGRRAPVAGRILMISRLKEQKGHKYLMEACGILKKRGVSHECILIGTGPEYERISRQIAELDLGDTVRLMGAVANDRLQPYLDSAAVFTVPAVIASDGDRDGIPVALMEALACEVPVVSTAVSGIPELLRAGEAGRLVPEGDAEALADSLQSLLTAGETAQRLATAGRRAVEEEFDIRETSRRLRELFANTIETRQRRPPARAAAHTDAPATEAVQ